MSPFEGRDSIPLSPAERIKNGLEFLKENEEGFQINLQNGEFIMSAGPGKRLQEILGLEGYDFNTTVAQLIGDAEDLGYKIKQELVAKGSIIFTLTKTIKPKGETIIDKGYNQGLEFLTNNHDDIVIRLGFIPKMETVAAEAFERSIEAGLDFSGSTFNLVLSSLIKKSSELGYLVTKTQEGGNDIIKLTRL